MKTATLLYIKNRKDEYLLMKRKKEPNKGRLSPPGGKLDQTIAETPLACAVREAYEECSIISTESDWKLRGIICERNFPGAGNILIFLMEYGKLTDRIPEECEEGDFYFIRPDKFAEYEIPETDRLFIWDKYLKSDKEVFITGLDCTDYPLIKVVTPRIL